MTPLRQSDLDRIRPEIGPAARALAGVRDVAPPPQYSLGVSRTASTFDG